jgi:predicted ATPase
MRSAVAVDSLSIGSAHFAVAMSDDEAGPNLRGRRSERAALDGLVADVRSGRGRVLMLTGEAGIGKTALLDHFCTRAAGFHLTRWVGTESETEFPFAGLRQRCERVTRP